MVCAARHSVNTLNIQAKHADRRDALSNDERHSDTVAEKEIIQGLPEDRPLGWQVGCGDILLNAADWC